MKKITINIMLLISIMLSSQSFALNFCHTPQAGWQDVSEMQNTLPCYLGSEKSSLPSNSVSEYNSAVLFYHKDKNILLTLKNNTKLPFQMVVNYYRNCSVEHSPTKMNIAFTLPAASDLSPGIVHRVIQSNCTSTWAKENYKYAIPEYAQVEVTNSSTSGNYSSILDQIDVYGEEY